MKRLVVSVVGAAMLVVGAAVPVVGQATRGSELCDAGEIAQFSDVGDSDYAAAYILCMRALGLSLGRGDGSYGPDRELNRGQMASFLIRLWTEQLGKQCPGGVVSPFTDTEGNIHKADIDCLYGLGITQGTSATTYSPKDRLEASQISRFLYRTYQKAGGDQCAGTAGSELDRAAECLVGLRVAPTTDEATSATPVTRAQMGVYVIGLWHNLTGKGLPPVPPQLPAPTTTTAPTVTVPGVPFIWRALPGNGRILIEWSAPADDGGSPITGYTVSFDNGQGHSGKLTVSDTMATIADLTNDATYTIKVTADNTLGSSPPAATTLVPSETNTVPGPPVLRVTHDGPGWVSVEWGPPADDGGSPVHCYYISYNDGPADGWCNTSNNQFSINLEAGVTYTFEATASNRFGSGWPAHATIVPTGTLVQSENTDADGDGTSAPALQEADAPPPLSAELAAVAGTPTNRVTRRFPAHWYLDWAGPKKGSETVTVFLCDPDSAARTADVQAATRILNDVVGTYFKWLSSGEFQFVFEAGTVIVPSDGSSCIETIEDRALSDNYLVIVRGLSYTPVTGWDPESTFGYIGGWEGEFGWTGHRLGKAAAVTGTLGTNGLLPPPFDRYQPGYDLLWRQSRYGYMSPVILNVIDALSHTHLGLGIRTIEEPAPVDGIGPITVSTRTGTCYYTGGSFFEDAGNVTPENPKGYQLLHSCWDTKLLGWPHPRGKCNLIPGKHASLAYTEIGEHSINIAWDEPEELPYSSPVEGYVVGLKTLGTDGEYAHEDLHILDAAERQITLTDLSPTKIYSAEVHVLYEQEEEAYTGALGFAYLSPRFSTSIVTGRDLYSLSELASHGNTSLLSAKTKSDAPYATLAGTFSPREKASSLSVKPILPGNPTPDEITPSLQRYRMTWPAHPDAVSYTVVGLGNSTVWREPTGSRTIGGYNGGSVVSTPEYTMHGWQDQLAFGTMYEIAIMACIPPRYSGSISTEGRCTSHEYIRKRWTSLTQAEFVKLFYPEHGPSASDLQGQWDSSKSNIVENVEINTQLHTTDDGELARISLTFDPVPGAFFYSVKNPFHDPSISHDQIGDGWPVVNHDLRLPILSSRTPRIETWYTGAYDETVTFEDLQACSPFPGTDYNAFGWPSIIRCGTPVDIDLVIPAP